MFHSRSVRVKRCSLKNHAQVLRSSRSTTVASQFYKSTYCSTFVDIASVSNVKTSSDCNCGNLELLDGKRAFFLSNFVYLVSRG